MLPCTDNCTVFHGTNLLSAMIIQNVGIILDAQRKLTDYGKGFYVTFSLEQAKDWAQMKALNPQVYPEMLKMINMSKAQYLNHPYRKIPVYLTFDIDLTQLLSLKGMVFPMPKDVYWPNYKKAWEIFVRNCRMGISHEYDFVYGPVGGRHPGCNYNMIASATKDQLSLNSIKALGCLSNLKIFPILPELHPLAVETPFDANLISLIYLNEIRDYLIHIGKQSVQQANSILYKSWIPDNMRKHGSIMMHEIAPYWAFSILYGDQMLWYKNYETYMLKKNMFCPYPAV